MIEDFNKEVPEYANIWSQIPYIKPEKKNCRFVRSSKVLQLKNWFITSSNYYFITASDRLVHNFVNTIKNLVSNCQFIKLTKTYMSNQYNSMSHLSSHSMLLTMPKIKMKQPVGIAAALKLKIELTEHRYILQDKE